MHSTARLYPGHGALDSAMVEAITPDSVTDAVSTEELDENLCSAASPRLSDETVGHTLNHLSSHSSTGTTTSTGYSPPVRFATATEKNVEKKWNLVKVHVGFDVTRKGERSLVIDGYKFTKSRDGIGGRVFWRCSRRECKATAVTVADKVEHIRTVHSHQPPVAAEFFSDNAVRSEQLVRFNNSASYSRSRVRRLNQPEPLEPAEQNSVPAADNFHVLPTNVGDDLPKGCLHNGHSVNNQPAVCDRISSGQVPTCASTTSITGFTAQTLTALITHLVETNPSSKSFHSSTSSNVELPSATSVDQSTKVSSLNSLCGLHPSDRENSVHNRIPVIECNDISAPRSGPSSLEQLAAIATSFATSGTTLSSDSHISKERPRQLEYKLSVPTMVHSSPVPTVSIPANPPNVVNEHSSATHFQCTAAANAISPGNVGFIGKNSQGQLVVLGGEQLSEWFRIQQSQKVHNSTVRLTTDESSNEHNTAHRVARSSPGSPVLTEQQYPVNTCSRWDHQEASHYPEPQARLSNRTVNTWPSAIVESTTSESSEIWPRLDELPKSLSCIVSLSNKSPDAKPIMVTALQVQPPGSPINPAIIPFHTFGLQSSVSTSKQLTHSEGRLTDIGCAPPVCMVTDVVDPYHHSDIHQSRITGPSPSLLVHWKKEKIRESVEEDGSYPETGDEDHSVFGRLTENSIATSLHSGSCLITGRRPPSAKVLDGEPASKMCFCEDVMSKTFSGSIGNHSHSLSQPAETYHLSCVGSSTRIAHSTRNLLTVSVGVDEEEVFCSQVQDGVLVKMLNTVQHLTAKLDADADPPEVIENCRAIQACLDTIAVVKRVRSVSGTCSPRVGLDPTGKPLASVTEVFTDCPRSVVTTSIPSCLSNPILGFQNDSVHQFVDSNQSLLPA